MKTEVWQRGAIEGIPPLLQPVAHALLQALEEMQAITKSLPDHLLWKNLYHSASPGFHMLHMSGVIDRLFTYARSEALTVTQLENLKKENSTDFDVTTADLVRRFSDTVDMAFAQLKATPESSLTEFRGIGKKQLPSTVMGLLFHSAEHIMRHSGQLLVTVRTLTELDAIAESDNTFY